MLEFFKQYGLVILQMIGFEGILSGENVLSLLVIVSTLPAEVLAPWPFDSYIWGGQRQAALRFGIFLAFAFRIAALFVVNSLNQLWYFRVVGGIGLVLLAAYHLYHLKANGRTREVEYSSFWWTLLKIEFVDLFMSLDNVVAAVALTDNFTVIIIGVCIGIIMVRLGAMIIQRVIDRFPELKSAAYVILLQLGVFLAISGFARAFGKEFHVPEWVQFIMSGLIVSATMGSAWINRSRLPITGEKFGGTARRSLILTTNDSAVFEGFVEPKTQTVNLQLAQHHFWDKKLLPVFLCDFSVSVGDLWAHWFWRASLIERVLEKISAAFSRMHNEDSYSLWLVSGAGQRGVCNSTWKPGKKLFPKQFPVTFGNESRLSFALTHVVGQHAALANDTNKNIVLFVLTDGLYDEAEFEAAKDSLRALAFRVKQQELRLAKVIFVGIRDGAVKIIEGFDNLEEAELDIADHTTSRELLSIRDHATRSRLLFKEAWMRSTDSKTIPRVVVTNELGEELFAQDDAPATIQFQTEKSARRITVQVGNEKSVLKLPPF